MYECDYEEKEVENWGGSRVYTVIEDETGVPMSVLFVYLRGLSFVLDVSHLSYSTSSTSLAK
jgi:hypothetical protein